MNKNLVLLLSVLVFTFLAMEITLRIFYPQNFGYYAKRDEIGLNILREKERFIQNELVKKARIPRKDFLSLYPDNLTKVRWVDSLMKEKKYKKDLLEKVKQDVVIAQKDIFCTNLSGFKKLNGSKVEKRTLPPITIGLVKAFSPACPFASKKS